MLHEQHDPACSGHRVVWSGYGQYKFEMRMIRARTVQFDVKKGLFACKGDLNKQSNRQITEENSSGTILKHVKSVESVLCDKHKFSSYVSN